MSETRFFSLHLDPSLGIQHRISFWLQEISLAPGVDRRGIKRIISHERRDVTIDRGAHEICDDGGACDLYHACDPQLQKGEIC